MGLNRRNSEKTDRTPTGRIQRLRAFTLIELLVVVAIIAMLVAILLPSLVGAREQARGAVCGARIKECTTATVMAILERQADRAAANFGWGTLALFQLGGVTETFLCPSDKNPDAIPAFLDRQYKDGQLNAVVSPDSPFSTFESLGDDRWRLNIQDQIDGASLGGDLDTDLVFEYDAPKGAKLTTVTITDASVAWGHTITDYKGKTVADKTAGKQFTVPLLWSSFAMNASAGIKNQKASPRTVLLVEYRNLDGRKGAAVPEQLGDWPQDSSLAKAVQARHPFIREERNKAGQLVGLIGKANVGFIDGHVERVDTKKLWLRTPNPLWHPQRPTNVLWRPAF
jgi:prepilin-type N-terminal cleavage/methylation domain-containing protein/prepilin-type processing-associated H-X9-DG protein